MNCEVCGQLVQHGDGVSPDGRGQVHRTCLSSAAGTVVALVPTLGWRYYDTDGYRFALKADGKGGLLIERPID